MTMDAMVRNLEKQGFEVSKTWIPDRKAYQFIITKGDKHVCKHFEYPITQDNRLRDALQRNFLSNIVDEFCVRFEKEKSMTRDVMALSRANNVAIVADGVAYPIRLDTVDVTQDAWHTETKVTCYVNEPLCDSVKQVVNYAAVYSSMKNYDSQQEHRTLPAIENVIFSNPATIILWKDGTKTVVKAENEPFDPEKGLAMAISKKVLGNKGNYFNEFKKWLPENHREAVPEEAWDAYQRLLNALHDKKATKKDLIIAMEEAVGYLGAILAE